MSNATPKQLNKIVSIFENAPAEKLRAILASGFLADLRDGDIGKIDRKKFRRDLGLDFLKSINTIKIPAITEKFIAKDRFIIDTSDNAPVKISYLGDDFKKWFLGKIEKPFIGSTLHCVELLEPKIDSLIIDELDGIEKVETSLAEMVTLMERQPSGKSKGERGILFTTDRVENVFYIPDINGILRVVSCRSFGDGWYVDAYLIDDPEEWDDGNIILSRIS